MKVLTYLLFLASSVHSLATEEAAAGGKKLPSFKPEVLKVEKKILGPKPLPKMPEILMDMEMDGSATIRGKKVPAEQLVKHLKDLEKDKSKWRIVLRGPYELPATSVQKILDVLGEAGYENISFAVKDKAKSDKKADAEVAPNASPN